MIGLIVILIPWLKLVETRMQIQFMKLFFQKITQNPNPIQRWNIGPNL
uniref:Uncharacterized protein n=1 Tax=Arundo donax TaxID=35708 RepID=A0A0A9GPD6_ARUDO